MKKHLGSIFDVNNLPTVSVSASVKVHCLCGCNRDIVIDLPAEIGDVGGLMVWTRDDIEIAIGLPWFVFVPKLWEMVKDK